MNELSHVPVEAPRAAGDSTNSIKSLLELRGSNGGNAFQVQVNKVQNETRAQFSVTGSRVASGGIVWEPQTNPQTDPQTDLSLIFTLSSGVSQLTARSLPPGVDLSEVSDNQQTLTVPSGSIGAGLAFKFSVAFTGGGQHDPIMVVTPL